MIRSRTVLAGLGLLLLSALLAGWYLHRHLPALLHAQALSLLQPYGVETLQIDGLAYSASELSFDRLQLQGSRDDTGFRVALGSATMHYRWHSLLRGRLDALQLDELAIVVEQPARIAAEDADQLPFTLAMDQLLSPTALTMLPIRSLHIEHLTLDLLSAEGSALAARGSLHIDGQVDLQLAAHFAGGEMTAAVTIPADLASSDIRIALRDREADIATLNAQPRQLDGDEWEWHVQARGDHVPVLAWLRDFTAATGRVPALLADGGLGLGGDSTLIALIRHPRELTFDTADELPLGLPPELGANIRLVTTIEQLSIPDTVDALRGTLVFEIEVDAGRIVASVPPFALTGSVPARSLALPEGLRDWLGWDETTPASLASEAPLSLAIADDGWTARAGGATLKLGDPDNQLRLEVMQLYAAGASGPSPRVETQFSGSLHSWLHKQSLPRFDFAFTQQGSREHSTIELRLADDGMRITADLQGTLDLATGAGTQQLRVRTPDLPGFSAIAMPLLRQLGLLANDAAIDAGSIRLDTTLRSRNYDIAQWEQRSRTVIEGVSGRLGEIRFEGLDIAADWSGMAQWRTHKPVELQLASVRPGFQIRELRARISLPEPTPIASPRLLMEDFSADMFGGRLYLPQAQHWDFAAPDNRVTLAAEGWQLAELVALQKNRDLQAQGTLEGQLPMTVADGRLMISDGYLRALPPGGSIRYAASGSGQAVGSTVPELAFALDLLSDFQYNALGSTVQLDKAGNLLLQLSIAGSNPSRYAGQPIEFNINLEQNIDPLLQSLRLGDTLVKRIEGGLQ